MADMDFFEMLNQAHTNRLEDQRSTVMPTEKPMMLNFDLLKNQLSGEHIVTDTTTTFPCNYLGHSEAMLTDNKELLCNKAVWEACKGKSTTKQSANPWSNTVKVDPTGVEFTVGDSGHARVTIPLHQVACVSLCPKKKDGPLKVVAILCRAAAARDGKLRRGEMEMVVHMTRLKDTRTMWSFQAAFVNALRIAFPEHHPPAPEEATNKPDAPEPEELKAPVPAPYVPPAVAKPVAPKEPTAPKAFIHKVFVKSKEQIEDDDAEMAEKLQRQEAIDAAAKKALEAADLLIIKALQEEEDVKFARASQASIQVNFDDDDGADGVPP